MAEASSRALWKVAISSGLVHIPVSLHSTVESGLGKIKAGNTESVTPLEPMETSDGGAQILDLTELLKRSLKKPAAGKAGQEDGKDAESRPKSSAASRPAKASPAKPPSTPRKTAQPKSRAA